MSPKKLGPNVESLQGVSQPRRAEQRKGPKSTGYKRTPREQAIIKKMMAYKAASGIPRLVLDEDEDILCIRHPDQEAGRALIADAFGSLDMIFVAGLAGDLVAVAGSHRESKQRLDYMAAVIKAIAPRDELEALEAAHLALTHAAFVKVTCSMMMMGKADFQSENLRARTLSIVSESFVAQREALERRRKDAEQPPKTSGAPAARTTASSRPLTKAKRTKPTARALVSAPLQEQAGSVVIPMKRRVDS